MGNALASFGIRTTGLHWCPPWPQLQSSAAEAAVLAVAATLAVAAALAAATAARWKTSGCLFIFSFLFTFSCLFPFRCLRDQQWREEAEAARDLAVDGQQARVAATK